MPKLAATLLTAATAAAGATAESSSTLTRSWMNLGFDNTPVASVIAADATAATYLIACSPSTTTTTTTASTNDDDDDDVDVDSSDCGIPGNAMTLIAGPSTMRYQYSASSGATAADVTMDEYCDITASTERAVCTAVIGGKDADFPGTQTATFTGTDISWSPLYVTAGQEKLAAAAAAATKAGASASATAEATGSSSGAAAATSEGSSSATGSSSGTGSAATASSTGGAVGRVAVPIVGAMGVFAAALVL
ncbi:GPI anchored protein [Lasiodiplodia theobromae]|uniref:GPI anchored cell wall protein n=1 Tax=Lasiodiplodia theobromae TaxID=45133 RepID=UPI0015C359B8|nr:GPI anchored cell wall protein [Lasiodiplodia theobromae]KAF4542010.1 GPI anchored cell wall protein [Lasiodiplodia theobromae]KAF9632964.1 GPI anchored protein [Lasiodiplodia theobromae]